MQEAMRLRSDRLAYPRRELPSQQSGETGLSCPQAEEVSQLVWYPKEFQTDLPVGKHRSIAPQPLGPREPKMRPLRPRQDRRSRAALAGWGLRLPHLNMLISHELYTGPPMFSAAPIAPEQRGRTHLERMQQHTDLARLCRHTAMPLTLLA